MEVPSLKFNGKDMSMNPSQRMQVYLYIYTHTHKQIHTYMYIEKSIPKVSPYGGALGSQLTGCMWKA